MLFTKISEEDFYVHLGGEGLNSFQLEKKFFHKNLFYACLGELKVQVINLLETAQLKSTRNYKNDDLTNFIIISFSPWKLNKRFAKKKLMARMIAASDSGRVSKGHAHDCGLMK